MSATRDVENPWFGLPIGVNDRNGQPLHVGDVLDFDPAEWGGPHQFTIKFERATLLHSGSVDDLSTFCTLVRRFDGRDAAEGTP